LYEGLTIGPHKQLKNIELLQLIIDLLLNCADEFLQKHVRKFKFILRKDAKNNIIFRS